MSRPRAKIDLELKKKARKLFESGVDMFDIHLKLKINLGSLYNISSKEGWEKGKRKELIYFLETEEELKALKSLQVEIVNEYKEITTENKAILKELQSEEKECDDGSIKRSLVKSRAEALINYTKAATESYELDKSLYDIKTPEEEIRLAIERLKYERLKKTLSQGLEDEKVISLDY